MFKDRYGKFSRPAARFGAAAALVFQFISANDTLAQATISPPQGYIGFSRAFAGPQPVYWEGTQRGYYAFDYEFRLDNTSGELAGTFWSNSISFNDSANGLPPNHSGGSQGGYLGVQVKSATESIAIFSIWWALDARPGPGAHCVSDIEAWYLDDRPFDPPIHSMNESDPARRVSGGPFRSCRLPIELAPGVTYRLRLGEVSDARLPDEPEWWSATLVNVSTGEEMRIGDLQVPGSWGWLEGRAGGFIEHFGPMPQGCDSIPASSSTFFAVSADGGSRQSSISAYVYGKCKDSLQPRTQINCADGRCDIELAD